MQTSWEGQAGLTWSGQGMYSLYPRFRDLNQLHRISYSLRHKLDVGRTVEVWETGVTRSSCGVYLWAGEVTLPPCAFSSSYHLIVSLITSLFYFTLSRHLPSIFLLPARLCPSCSCVTREHEEHLNMQNCPTGNMYRLCKSQVLANLKGTIYLNASTNQILRDDKWRRSKIWLQDLICMCYHHPHPRNKHEFDGDVLQSLDSHKQSWNRLTAAWPSASEYYIHFRCRGTKKKTIKPAQQRLIGHTSKCKYDALPHILQSNTSEIHLCSIFHYSSPPSPKKQVNIAFSLCQPRMMQLCRAMETEFLIIHLFWKQFRLKYTSFRLPRCIATVWYCALFVLLFPSEDQTNKDWYSWPASEVVVFLFFLPKNFPKASVVEVKTDQNTLPRLGLKMC